MRDFQFSDAARKHLREYLDHGGALVVDDAVGSTPFDTAFRREIKLIYPDKSLQPLPANHPVMTFVSDAGHVALAPMGERLSPGVDSPQLEAIEVDGTLPVIYSPLSMSAGWEQLPRAYDKGYTDDDSLKLGVNVFMYEVTH